MPIGSLVKPLTSSTPFEGFQTMYPGGTNSPLGFFNTLSGPTGYGTLGYPFSTATFQPKGLGNIEAQSGINYQTPTNVLQVGSQLQNALSGFTTAANRLGGTNVNLGRASLGQDFQGADAFKNQLNGGIDYFGRLGISEGLQNIGLQREAANRQLADMFGRNASNGGLLGILQNQNLFRSQLAANPLVSQAQKDTAGRVEQMINLNNQLQQLKNQTTLQQLGFNQQGQLSELQAKLGLMQPQQNLLEILSNLQGQARGLQNVDNQILGRNFK